MADYVGENMSSADNSAGAAPAETNKTTSRPPSVTRDNRAPYDTANLDDNGSDSGGLPRDPTERLRVVREKQNTERQRRLDELKAAALAAQQYRSQRDHERRQRIDEMRARDTDRRHQVEERKRAIGEAERARREALVRREREREARLEGRRASRPGSAGGLALPPSFAFGSSTPRMLEPADTGGSFWGHRRATSTSNVMFAALPLARRPSERELSNIDGADKKRATSAGGLDKDEENADSSSQSVWCSVARRRTDLVPTIPARDSPRYTPPVHSQASGTGRAYSMTRLDQLARPRRPTLPAPPPPPAVPPRRSHHRSMVQLPHSPAPHPHPPPRKHRIDNAGLKSGEQTPGSLSSRPGSSLSGAGASSAALPAPAAAPRRPRSTPRRPRPASIAGTGVTTPPSETKLQTQRAEKPPLPRVHSASARKWNNVTPPQPSSNVPAEKPEPPKRTHKTPTKPPQRTPLKLHAMQSSMIEEPKPAKIAEFKTENETETSVMTVTKSVENDNKTITSTTVTTTVEKVETIGNNGEADASVVETSHVEVTKMAEAVSLPQVSPEVIVAKEPSEPKAEVKLEAESDASKYQELSQSSDPLEGADMTGSLMSRNRMITTEEEAKAALAERRRLAREEAEKQAEKDRLRGLREEEEERGRRRAAEEQQRRLEEEALALAAAARANEEQRLAAAIREAQAERRAEEQRLAEEAAARAAREAAEREARRVAESARRDAAERAARDEVEREARRRRVEAIMLRTRRVEARRDGDKSPTDESKDDAGDGENQKSTENLSQSLMEEGNQPSDNAIAYEMSVREREETLFNHSASHNQPQHKESGSVQNGSNNISNANGDNLIDAANGYASQNGHKKSESNGIDNIINNGSQYNLTLDNAVKQNNVTNNLLDFSEFDDLNTANSNNPFLNTIMNGSSQQSQQNMGNVNQILDLSLDRQTIKGLTNEDSLNSNATPNSPFISSFQSNQENRDLSLL